MPGRRLKLVIRPDGRAILTCDEPLSLSEQTILVEAFRAWDEGQALILTGVDVVTVVDIELDAKIIAEVRSVADVKPVDDLEERA